MSYLSQPQTSNRKLVALGVAAIVHVALGYALVTGLAFNAVKHIQKELETVDIKVEKEKEPPPPPPKEKLEEIPVVTPPPIVQVQSDAPPPPITTTTTIARPYVPPVISQPTQAVAPPAPPPPAPPAAPATVARLKRGTWQALITTDDYPDSSLRNEEEGTVRVELSVNERGKVDGCTVTQSSGHPKLDETTCNLLSRRAPLEPAKAEGGAPMRSKITPPPTRWQVPKDR